MRSPLAVASDGYLYKGKNLLSVAASGYLAYTKITPPIPTPDPPRSTSIVGGGSGGLGSPYTIRLGTTHTNRRYSRQGYYTDEPTKLELEDDELVLIIKTFLKCQK